MDAGLIVGHFSGKWAKWAFVASFIFRLFPAKQYGAESVTLVCIAFLFMMVHIATNKLTIGR